LEIEKEGENGAGGNRGNRAAEITNTSSSAIAKQLSLVRFTSKTREHTRMARVGSSRQCRKHCQALGSFKVDAGDHDEREKVMRAPHETAKLMEVGV